MPVERERRSEWEGERERRAQKPNPNEYFLPLENERGGWKKKVKKKSQKKKKEEGGPDSKEFMLVWWGPCAGLERRWGAERTLWTRLDDSTPSWVPFFKRGKETLRFTVTTSRLYSVHVKLHWGVQWITVLWCYKEPSPPIHHGRTLALFMFQRFTLTRQCWHFSTYAVWESRNCEKCEPDRKKLQTDNNVRKKRHVDKITVPFVWHEADVDKAASESSSLTEFIE